MCECNSTQKQHTMKCLHTIEFYFLTTYLAVRVSFYVITIAFFQVLGQGPRLPLSWGSAISQLHHYLSIQWQGERPQRDGIHGSSMDQSLLFTSRWLKLNLMVISGCKGAWEMQSSCVPERGEWIFTNSSFLCQLLISSKSKQLIDWFLVLQR